MNDLSLSLRAIIEADADAPAPDAAKDFAAAFAARPGVAAVLFYGNMMRDAGASGLLDLYVLTDRAGDWNGGGVAAAAGRLLPPNVYHERVAGAEAKVAVLTQHAFARRMRRGSWDTTLWARFAQPVRLVHARDSSAREATLTALETAAATAGWWAARLGDAEAPEAAWTALFSATYGAELRVEPPGRAQALVSAFPRRYRLLHEAVVAPNPPSARERRRSRRAWALRRRAGKALNLARLAKAAFTFRGGLPYIVSKVERHSGRPLELKPWERRLPWLAAPIVMLRLLREKRLR